MYLLCNLDDEHYTESIYEWHKTMDDAKERCVEMEVEVQGEEMREEILSHMEFYPVDESKCKFTDVPGIKSYRYDYHIGTSFTVNQIFEIPDDLLGEFLCIWYHAYDGVDFYVETIGSFDECLERKEAEEKDALANGYTLQESYQDFGCVDTDTEWECWNIVKAA